MSFPLGLVPTFQKVHPTPIYEFLASLVIGGILWKFADKKISGRPIGEVTGLYLILSGIARFLVEFIRINPRIYWGMSNAQVASIGSVLFGIGLIVWARRRATADKTTSRAIPLGAPGL